MKVFKPGNVITRIPALAFSLEETVVLDTRDECAKPEQIIASLQQR